MRKKLLKKYSRLLKNKNLKCYERLLRKNMKAYEKEFPKNDEIENLILAITMTDTYVDCYCELLRSNKWLL